MKTAAAALAMLASIVCGGVAQAAEPVDLLLVLAADVSRSIDDKEFELQRKGYAAALTDPRVIAAIVGGQHHAIATSFVEWSGAGDQNVVVDWTVIRDEEAANGMAATILSAPRSFVGRTSISAAIDFAIERMATAPVQASVSSAVIALRSLGRARVSRRTPGAGSVARTRPLLSAAIVTP